MNKPLRLTPEYLAKAFINTRPNFGVSESKHGSYLVELAEICIKHGMNNQKCILQLIENVIHWERSILFGLDKDRTTEEIKLGKDLAILTNVFKNGRNIKVQASVPDGTNSEGGVKEKHINIDVETCGFLKELVFLCFNSSLIALFGSGYKYSFGLNTPDNLNQDILQQHGIIDSGSFFKEPYSDEALSAIIEFETSEMDFDKSLKGRNTKTKIEIPRLGFIAHSLIKSGGENLVTMRLTEKHCLVFDLMVAAGICPIEEELRDRELKNKDKADMVKYWISSSKKIIGEDWF